MAIIHVGSGSYLDYIPPGQVGVVDYNGVPISPAVASGFTEPIPTNSWDSSLVFPFFGGYDSVSHFFSQPMAYKTESAGLALSYTDTPTFYKDNTGTIVKYEYTFHSDPVTHANGDLSVELAGMNATKTLLEQSSDWVSKAVWQDSDSSNQLHATFGHGSPFTYFERAGNADVVIKVNSINANTIGQPNATNEAFEMHHVNGTYNGGAINMDLLVNAVAGQGSNIGNAVEARISIDTNGDGKVDYVQTINYYPLDADVSNSEHYLQSEARGVGASTIGTLQNLNDATIKVEVWKSFGSGDVQVQTGNTSSIALPFDNLSNQQGAISNKIFLDNDGTHNLLTATPAAAETITLGAAPKAGPTIPWDGAGDVYYFDHNVIGITINGNNYGLFAPVGSEWVLENGEIHSNLNGKDYFSTAILPDNSVSTLQYFYQHAYAFITDSKADYVYDKENAKVITDFHITTDLKEAGFSDQALTALFRHQWLNTNDPLTNYSYESPRGEMKVLEGNSFETHVGYTGILPALPNMLDATQTQHLYQMVDTEYQTLLAKSIPIPEQDSYGAGKELAKYSELTEIANQVGHNDAKNLFLDTIKNELQNWFTADGTTNDKEFVYNSQWDTLQAYPASFESQKELNDHHFHYGYFLKAASTIAQFDPSWVSQWGGMVDLMIKDVANTDRGSTMFPYLRNFDPFEGHSWANGHGAFASGNNQESTSEAMNFASALISWGAQTNDSGYQALGAYLYSTELSAVQQYWFDLNNAVFPDGFNHNEASIVWSDGATYSTFFGGMPNFPEFIHGIQFLPMSGGSLYLGLDPANAQINYNDLVQSNAGPVNQWVNIIMEYQAMFDSQSAVNALNAGYTSMSEPTFESGDTLAHNYDWVQNFNVLGKVDAGVIANAPFFAVFNKDGLITHTAYNPGSSEITVHFSDGYAMTLEGEELKATNDHMSWSSVTGTVVNPDPTPVPVPDPTPTPTPVPDPTPVPTPTPDPTPVPTPAPDPTPTPTITGTSGNDTLTGTMGNDVMLGLAGDDQLHGLVGDDVLDGGAGNDHIYGREGNDVLIGGAGQDFLVGGDGNDAFKYSSLSDSTNAARDFIETFEQGHDRIDLSALNVAFNQLQFSQENGYTIVKIANTDFALSIGNGVNLTESDFVLSGSSSQPNPTPVPDPTPTPAITGTAGDDFMTGTPGNDVMFGLGGNDQMHGTEGADKLYGGDGDDHMYGNAGDDTLIGGAGKDFMVGGDGHNLYVFETLADSSLNQRDTIEAFKTGQDKVDLTALHVSANDVHIQAHDGIQSLTVNNTDFAVDFIASDPIKPDDIIV